MKIFRRNRATATVTVSDTSSRVAAEYDLPVKSLQGLYTACRESAAAGLVKVTLHGAEGDLSLHFASLVKKPAAPRRRKRIG